MHVQVVCHPGVTLSNGDKLSRENASRGGHELDKNFIGDSSKTERRKRHFAQVAPDSSAASFCIAAQFAIKRDGRECDDRAVCYDADFLAGDKAERSQPFPV